MTTHVAPGAWRPANDRHGSFEALAAALPSRAFVLLDARVHQLHPGVMAALQRSAPLDVILVRAGESAKSFSRLEDVVSRATSLPRRGTLVCIGGGTLGDLGTVAAHLIKRGVQLIHVPTTLLGQVDSSLGGKGAIHVGAVKNALGVFHYPDATWLCPEFLSTLRPQQLREGRAEAWKMAVTLDAPLFDRWSAHPPSVEALIVASRALKERVCESDPYDQHGVRTVLNFGHTFGHVIESLSRFKISHGDAVGLGMLIALDIGRSLGFTPSAVANHVENTLGRHVPLLDRERLAKVLLNTDVDVVRRLLMADKKGADADSVTMVLLTAPGLTTKRPVTTVEWSALLPAWQQGVRP